MNSTLMLQISCCRLRKRQTKCTADSATASGGCG